MCGTPNDAESELSYLEHNASNKLTLKRNHTYFMQCQIQMAVTGINKCYFVVWTAHGIFTEQIEFNQDLWENNKQTLTDFFFNHYVPSLFLNKNVSP